MPRYHIIFGILLILPIIDIAVAAPVLVQEKLKAGADVLHIREDAITMLGKRGDEIDEVLLKTVEKYGSQSPTKPESSSAASLRWPSSQADGSTVLKNPLTPIPEEPSPAPSSPLTMASMESHAYLEEQGDDWWRRPPKFADLDWNDWTNLEDPATPTSASPKEFGEVHGDQVKHVQRPDQLSSTVSESDVDWNGRQPLEKRPKLASSSEFGQADENQLQHLPRPSQPPLTASNADWNGPSPTKKRPMPTSSNEFGQADENQLQHLPRPSQPPLTASNADWNGPSPTKKRPMPTSSNEYGQAVENQVEHVQQSDLPLQKRPNLGVSSPGPSNPGPSTQGFQMSPGTRR
jgi:hypothetical protein